MSILIFFPVVFIWIGILHHLKNRASRSEEAQSKQFWELEREANTVRRKELSSLPYIHIPLESLPLKETKDLDLQHFQESIRSLSTKEIINFTGVSNTELKLSFGPSNLEKLSEFDSNYTELVRTLSNWARYLYDHGNVTDAKTVLEYGIRCKTDIKNNYILLAQIYYDNQEQNKISDLISQAESLNTLMKSSIIHSLQKIMEQPEQDNLSPQT